MQRPLEPKCMIVVAAQSKRRQRIYAASIRGLSRNYMVYSTRGYLQYVLFDRHATLCSLPIPVTGIACFDCLLQE